jgi:hypothetical protein
MVESYMNTVNEHFRKVVLMNQRDWEQRLPLFMQANEAPT